MTAHRRTVLPGGCFVHSVSGERPLLQTRDRCHRRTPLCPLLGPWL